MLFGRRMGESIIFHFFLLSSRCGLETRENKRSNILSAKQTYDSKIGKSSGHNQKAKAI